MLAQCLSGQKIMFFAIEYYNDISMMLLKSIKSESTIHSLQINCLKNTKIIKELIELKEGRKIDNFVIR